MQSVLLRPADSDGRCFVVFLMWARVQPAACPRHRAAGNSASAGWAGRWRVVGSFLREPVLAAMARWRHPWRLLGSSLLWILPPIGYPVDFDFSMNRTRSRSPCCVLRGSLLTARARRAFGEKGPDGGPERRRRSGTPAPPKNRTRACCGLGSGVPWCAGGHRLFARSFQNARSIDPASTPATCCSRNITSILLPESRAAGAILLPLRDASGSCPALPRKLRELPCRCHRDRQRRHTSGRIRAAGRTNERIEATVAPGFFDALRIRCSKARLHGTGRPRRAPVHRQQTSPRLLQSGNPVGRRSW